jgi:hypothetical protein
MNPKVRKLLAWLERSSPLLESQIVGSGLSGALNDALRDGLADMGAHPTVQERSTPAAAVFITDAGRKEVRKANLSRMAQDQ